MNPKARARVDLFLVSFLILFFELAAIRWFAASVVFLTFFTNLVLLASFLGMSVGLLTTSRPGSLARTVLPLALLSLLLALLTFMAYTGASSEITVDVGNQQGSPAVVYFGTEYRPVDPSRWVIPIWAVGGAFFALIAVTFVGLGQAMGRAFDAIPDRVTAYSIDVLGSLSGIAVFAAMSHLELGPLAWFLVVTALILYFAGRSRVQFAAAGMLLAAAAYSALVPYGERADARIAWSPYYKVIHTPSSGMIATNNIGHQVMMDVTRTAPAYLAPHLLNRDAGGKPFEEVLVIGAGSGNDVAAALHGGARHVDAVEIDPLIQRIGRAAHPNRPYADPRVAARLDDGRSFVRASERKYDLVVYAVVDSLVLHSGYASLRLENFLFTQEAFDDIRRSLKPDGVFVMYNVYRQGWVAGRLAKMAEQSFGAAPIVISLPHRATIEARDGLGEHMTFLLAGTDGGRLKAIRERFERGEHFWIADSPADNLGVNAFGAHPPSRAAHWWQLAPAKLNLEDIDLVPTDDWPQLYLRERAIPWAPIGQGMAVVLVLSLAILLGFAGRRGMAFDPRMFFLGAGFMLLETKGVVHMALLFGSTWAVNSVVFFAILVMILCANLFVQAVRPKNLLPWYGLLAAALLVNALVPMSAFLSLGPVARTLSSCAVVFVPVFFAGVIFATAFRDSRTPGADFGANVAGIILGGMSEQLSLVIGFNHLILVAIAYYLLSMLPLRRSLSAAG